jgi:histidinol-phosphatase (PHP family)
MAYHQIQVNIELFVIITTINGKNFIDKGCSMIADIHNHTKLCNHAIGEIEEYIQKAIEKKVKHFGFSDHAPMEFDKEYRMSFDDMKKYENSISTLKEKYKDDIEILLGYEVDFLPNYMDERVLKANVDYLIGSVHFLNGWGFDNPKFIGEYKNKDIDKIWQDYFDTIKELAKSGLFDIVGHIDLIKVFKYLPKKEVKLIAKDAIKEIKKSNLVVELNMAGYKKPINELYPSYDILEMIKEYDIPITFGSDAHKPDEVCRYEDRLKEVLSNFSFNKCAIFEKRDRKLLNF